MLRTMQGAGLRGAGRFPLASRSGLRAQPVSRLPVSRISTQRTFTTTNSTRSKASTNFTFTSDPRPSPLRTQTILQRLRSSVRFFHNSRTRVNGKPTSPSPTSNLHSPSKGSPAASTAAEAEPQTLRARMRKLSREYGWSAVGVYFMLTALDFPFCYLLVRYLGTDKIGEWEHLIVSNLKRIIPESVQQTWHDWRAAIKNKEREVTGGEQVTDHVEMVGWGVEEAEERNKRDASLATQLALAYAIHKSFIFIRVPLTAALTPKVVKILRGWGWDIGKRTTKEAKALKRASNPPPKSKSK